LAGRFDFDDLSTKIAENLAAEWASQQHAKLYHPQAF
jgi:hypothetical protein